MKIKIIRFLISKKQSLSQGDILLKKGFSLIELLMVIAIIGILSSIVMTSISTSKENLRVGISGEQQRAMMYAVELYYDDMGFYPPDVNRGWDPGFARDEPWNPDYEAGEPPSGSYALAGTNCDHCPSNWEAIVEARWNGPYLPDWPRFTQWEGKYDYNYWATSKNRSGCTVDPGIYIGIQGNYENESMITNRAEELMIEKRFDSEECMNNESQMILHKL